MNKASFAFDTSKQIYDTRSNISNATILRRMIILHRVGEGRGGGGVVTYGHVIS